MGRTSWFYWPRNLCEKIFLFDPNPLALTPKGVYARTLREKINAPGITAGTLNLTQVG